MLHSGGWKKLESEKVSAHTFRVLCQETLGAISIHNFYGLAEQNGSVFVECEHHHLHCPVYSDIIVRCPQTFDVLPHGQKGVLQLCSILPRSYPGHLLLTEDEGVILGEDDCPCGRKGRYFHILGRIAKHKCVAVLIHFKNLFMDKIFQGFGVLSTKYTCTLNQKQQNKCLYCTG